MADSLSMSEIFLLAENIEKQGLEFYKQAALTSQNVKVKEVMLFLADEETRHAEIFADLRQKFFGSDDIYLNHEDEEATRYITGLVDTHVFNVSKDVAELLGAIQTPKSAIEMAINFEKDTIACFTGFKKLVQGETKMIDRLIQEEFGHIEKLEKLLTEIK